jgi:hypothetical protein
MIVPAGKNKVLGGNVSVIFAHAKITWNNLGSNPGLRDGKPVINRLIHDTVLTQ